jgi:hypothetical protein
MRTLWMVAVVMLVGASGCRKRVAAVIVPNTPDGLACQRQCMQVYETCVGGRARNEKACNSHEQGCLGGQPKHRRARTSTTNSIGS